MHTDSGEEPRQKAGDGELIHGQSGVMELTT